MANTDFKRFMAPDFQAQQGPALDWMPWQEDATAGNVGSVVDQLKQSGKMGGAKAPDGSLPYEGNMMPLASSGMATGGKAKGGGSSL